jgi:hypothetical protein
VNYTRCWEVMPRQVRNGSQHPQLIYQWACLARCAVVAEKLALTYC